MPYPPQYAGQAPSVPRHSSSYVEQLRDPLGNVAEILAGVHDDTVHRAIVGLETAEEEQTRTLLLNTLGC